MLEDPNKITFFAQTNSRGKEVAFGIKRRDRARHMYVIGKTGMGKSTLLENMAIQDVRNGEGVAFIDPHGGTAERIMEYVPEHRKEDVVYFAPFDMDYPVAFNVMEDVGYDKRHLVVSGLLSAFRKIWVDAWSARMEYILSNTLLALLEFPGATLLDVNRMLINKPFRKKVVDNVKDPIVKSFWVDEFANYGDRYTQEATPAIQNKIGQFTSNPLIRNIIGQPKSSFDIRKMMDERKIIIMNLSKGKVGEVNATLLGSMLVTKIYLAAMSRADVPAQTLAMLPSFYFYVDEFQSFSNQSFADILSEARKYKLNLIIAHQYIEQMEEEVRNAVFGNVGTTVAFRVGPFDAEVLETIFQPKFMATDLVNLGFAQIYLTLMIDGVGSPPFSATTLAPFDPPPQKFVNEVESSSRRQFGKPRTQVEADIAEWVAIEDPAPKSASSSTSSSRERATTTSSSSATRAPRRETVEVAPAKAAESTPTPHAAAQQQTPPQPVAPTSNTAAPRTPSAYKPPVERSKPVESRPPLSGAKSLREALEQATGKPIAGEPELKPQPIRTAVETPKPYVSDLRETLKNVAPKALNKEEKAAQAPQVASKPVTPPIEPSGLPEDVLRSMLAVDEPEEKK